MAKIEKNPREDGEYLNSLARGLAVLRAFSRDRPGMTLSELAAHTELNPAVVRRCLNTLMHLGYVAKKDNVRVLEIPSLGAPAANAFAMKRVGGGLLVQSPDDANVREADLRVVTRRAPSADEMRDLMFVWRVAKFVKSNAIVYGKDGQTLGVGAGQMSRVDSARIAAIKAANAGLSLARSAVASDAFFPFRDGLDVVADNGATAIIQPGGSMRDAEVIAAADERGLAMVFTGVRHFRH